MKTVGDFEVLGLLGRGGEGLVYKVRMPVTGRLAALKLFHPTEFLATLVGRDELERRFLGEARILGRLEHDNIVQALGVGRHGESPFYLLEYFCRDLGQTVGESWRVEAKSRPQPLPRAAGFVLQTLSGLARLHHAGLVHRDIKPANLLLDASDRVKIADFGLSALRGETGAHAPGLKVGSPFYAAPEQERDPGRAGPQADLYSAAMVLHRLLFGRVTEEPPAGPNRPSLLSPDMDRRWDRFFAAALSPDPAKRPASARAMAAQLTALMDDWRKRLGQACALPERLFQEDPLKGASDPPRKPRNRPVKARDAEARRLFGLDELFRPLRYSLADFASRATWCATGRPAWCGSGPAASIPWTGSRPNSTPRACASPSGPVIPAGGCPRWKNSPACSPRPGDLPTTAWSTSSTPKCACCGAPTDVPSPRHGAPTPGRARSARRTPPAAASCARSATESRKRLVGANGAAPPHRLRNMGSSSASPAIMLSVAANMASWVTPRRSKLLSHAA